MLAPHQPYTQRAAWHTPPGHRAALRIPVAALMSDVMAFYPTDLRVPDTLRAATFLARPLRVTDTARDYAAYMASLAVIRIHGGGRWATDDFTVAEEGELIARRERDHLARRNFTFTLLTPDQTRCVGCLYVLPLRPFLQRVHAGGAAPATTDATAMLTFWVRQEEQETDLPDQVARAVHAWMRGAWASDDHVFRVNQAEQRSVQALERAGLHRRSTIDLPASPYRYYLYGAPQA
jgi:hypothetical protein